jgi:hypothetical protein
MVRLTIYFFGLYGSFVIVFEKKDQILINYYYFFLRNDWGYGSHQSLHGSIPRYGNLFKGNELLH